MAFAYNSPRNTPLVVTKTCSMRKVLIDVESVAKNKHSEKVACKRPVTVPHPEASNNMELSETLDCKRNEEQNEIIQNSAQKYLNTPKDQQVDHRDSYDAKTDDDVGTKKLNKNATASKKRRTSASPAGRVRVHTAKGNMDFVDSGDDMCQAFPTDGPLHSCGDANSAVNINKKELSIILNPSTKSFNWGA